MQKQPSRRFATADEMAGDIEACRARDVPSAVRSDDTGAVLRAIRRPVVALPALAIVGIVGYLVVSMLIGQSRARWAREQAIPEIQRLLQQDEYETANDLARQAERVIPADPMLVELIAQITQAPALATQPEGARVFVKPYTSPQAEWRFVGTTPLEGIALPRGAYRWKIEAAGYETVEFARNVGDLVRPQTMALASSGGASPGMVAVPATRAPVGISGFVTEDAVALAPFEIDRTEVTNRQFKEFVDAGGYAKRDYWKHDIVRDGRTLRWEEAIEKFRDTSGRPGPATWSWAAIPKGRATFRSGA